MLKNEFKVESVKSEKKKRNPLPPYITSTLQQDAANRAWMQGTTYRAAVKAGDIMAGYSLGEVLESGDPKLKQGDLVFGVRPEHIHLATDGTYRGEVLATEYLGTTQIVTILVGDQEFDSPKTLAAFALGLTLFCITLALNFLALHIVRRYREQYD